jgi:hypothetical protein
MCSFRSRNISVSELPNHVISVSQLSGDLTSGLLDRPLHDIAAHKTSGGRFSVIAKPASRPFKEFNRRRTPSFPQRLVVTLCWDTTERSDCGLSNIKHVVLV